MTIQFIGNLTYGNHSILYPNLNFLKSDINFSTDLIELITNACNLAGINYTINGSFRTGSYEINWSDPEDITAPVAGRFRIGATNNRNLIIQARDDNGNFAVGTPSTLAFDAKLQDYNNENEVFRPALFFSVSKNHLCFGAFAVDSANTANTFSYFAYTGYLDNVNPNFNYYTSKKISQCFTMAKTSSSVWSGYHNIKGVNKPILTSNECYYPIVCADNQVPAVDWTTDLYIFDNDPDLGFPAIGKVRECIGSTSISQQIGVPGKIASNDTRWLSLGTWLGKTIYTRIL